MIPISKPIWTRTFVWLFLSLSIRLYVLHFEHSHFIYVSYISVISCAFLRHPFPFITPWFDSPSLFSLGAKPYGRRLPAPPQRSPAASKRGATWPSQDFSRSQMAESTVVLTNNFWGVNVFFTHSHVVVLTFDPHYLFWPRCLFNPYFKAPAVCFKLPLFWFLTAPPWLNHPCFLLNTHLSHEKTPYWLLNTQSAILILVYCNPPMP